MLNRAHLMIERILDRAVAMLLRVLALAFILAVLLNFANVIGRYVLGSSILWADEVEMLILVLITFLGTIVVSWRRQHLRMDVIFQMLPERLRIVIRSIEMIVVVVLAALVASQSYAYAAQMLMLGRVSDNAGIPMWMPHMAVAAGFALVAGVAIWQGVMVLTGVDKVEQAGDVAGSSEVQS